MTASKVLYISDMSLRLRSNCTIGSFKQTDAAAANLQISIQKDSSPSEFSRPLTSITLNLNGDLPVDRRRVSLLKLPNIVGATLLFFPMTSLFLLNKTETDNLLHQHVVQFDPSPSLA